jgi:hypothetical protein
MPLQALLHRLEKSGDDHARIFLYADMPHLMPFTIYRLYCHTRARG